MEKPFFRRQQRNRLSFPFGPCRAKDRRFFAAGLPFLCARRERRNHEPKRSSRKLRSPRAAQRKTPPPLRALHAEQTHSFRGISVPQGRRSLYLRFDDHRARAGRRPRPAPKMPREDSGSGGRFFSLARQSAASDLFGDGVLFSGAVRRKKRNGCPTNCARRRGSARNTVCPPR